jgi:hypothetical protein
LLEAHPAEFDKKRVRHESENQTRKKKLWWKNDLFKLKQNSSRPKRELPRDFADKLKYHGLLSTGRYLEYVYRSFHNAAHLHLALEVKKRDMDTLMLNVSYNYKETRHS